MPSHINKAQGGPQHKGGKVMKFIVCAMFMGNWYAIRQNRWQCICCDWKLTSQAAQRMSLSQARGTLRKIHRAYPRSSAALVRIE